MAFICPLHVLVLLSIPTSFHIGILFGYLYIWPKRSVGGILWSGSPSVRFFVCLSVRPCLSVRNSVPLTNKVPYLKFVWWYSNQTCTVSSSKGPSRFTHITLPWYGCVQSRLCVEGVGLFIYARTRCMNFIFHHINPGIHPYCVSVCRSGPLPTSLHTEYQRQKIQRVMLPLLVILKG